jgi:hypothetical protein
MVIDPQAGDGVYQWVFVFDEDTRKMHVLYFGNLAASFDLDGDEPDWRQLEKRYEEDSD